MEANGESVVLRRRRARERAAWPSAPARAVAFAASAMAGLGWAIACFWLTAFVFLTLPAGPPFDLPIFLPIYVHVLSVPVVLFWCFERRRSTARSRGVASMLRIGFTSASAFGALVVIGVILALTS